MGIFGKRYKEINNILIQNRNILNYSKNQKFYVNELNKETTSLIVARGPAGTGKTMLACNKAKEYLKNTDKKILITRPLVSVEDEQLGFLPGTVEKKMSPWMIPLLDYFLEDFTKQELNNLMNQNRFEITPLAYMRGRTFKNTFIIADEMQNSSPIQMKMLLTRIGEKSRIVITGDIEQSDLHKFNNGLYDLTNKLDKINDDEITMITLTGLDVERSSLVKKIIKIYNPIINVNDPSIDRA
jgi:phosphate starvation-inducible PhoH-like protein